ncbi:MAG: hypothetical protein E7035_08645 [Verrucomicrobiaceae bacterium]|nr:hypothetical protein [Verrucomicrobiaceae bacterium]
MKKTITTSLFTLFALSATYADISDIIIDSENSPYNWLTDGVLLAGNASITFDGSDLTLNFNRNAPRDYSGTMTITSGSTNNKVVVKPDGDGGSNNSLGFYGATITSVDEGSTLDFLTEGNGAIRFTGNGITTIERANVSVVGNALFQGMYNNGASLSSSFKLKAGATFTWNAVMKESVQTIASNLSWEDPTNTQMTDAIITISSESVKKPDGSGATHYQNNLILGSNAATIGDDGSYTFRNININGVKQTVNDKKNTYTIKTEIDGAPEVINFDNGIKNLKIVTEFAGGYSTYNLSGASVDLDATFVESVVNINSAFDGSFCVGASQNTTFNVNAGGTVSYVNGAGTNVKSCTVVFASGTTLNVTKRSSLNGQTFIFEEGASMITQNTDNTGTEANNIFGKNIMKKGSTLTVAGGIRMQASDIDGTINVNGAGSINTNYQKTQDSFLFALYGGTTIFGANSAINQKYSTAKSSDGVTVKNWLAGSANIVSNAGTGKLVFGNKVNFLEGIKVTLNTTDAFVIGTGESWGATSQASSIFTFTTQALVASGAGSRAVNSVFEINAENNIGGFFFEAAGNSTLELLFGENGSLTVGEDANITSFAGADGISFEIILEGEVKDQLRIFDLTEQQILDSFTVKNSEEYKLQIKDMGDGSFYVNAISTAVPEPAEWAVIFGAVALGFVAYRRRK